MKIARVALASVASLEHCQNQKVVASLPGLGMYLGYPSLGYPSLVRVHTTPSLGVYGRQPINAALSHRHVSPFLSHFLHL